MNISSANQDTNAFQAEVLEHFSGEPFLAGYPAVRCGLSSFGQSGGANSAAIHIAGWTSRGERINKIWAVLTPVGVGEEHKGSGKLVEVSVQTGE